MAAVKGRVALLAALLLVGQGALAQSELGGGPLVLPHDFVMRDLLTRDLVDRAVRSGRSPPAAARTATAYRASPEVTRRVRQQFLGWVAQTAGQQGAAELGRVMQQQDVLALWTEQMGRDGLRPGDVADAFAAYWVQNWQMATKLEHTTPAQVQSVRAQVAPILAANPAFRRLSEAQRQEMAEILIYNQFLQGTAWMAAPDAATKARLGDAAVARFRSEMGLDLRQLTLTERGFVATAGAR